MRNSSNVPLGGFTFKDLPFGGGGMATGLSIANDGYKLARVDVWNVYERGPSDTSWAPLLTSALLPVGEYFGSAGYVNPVNADTGVYEAVYAPTDSNRLYVSWNFRLYRRDTRGGLFVKTALPDTKMLSNSGYNRTWGRKMAVDNQNKDVFLLGTHANGLYWSSNGGTTVTNVSIGANSGTNPEYPHLVALDPVSTVTSTIRQRWFAVRQGTGIYVSTTGPGGPYTLMTGSPTSARWMEFDVNGNCWVVDDSGALNNLFKCAAGGTTWANASPSVTPASWDKLACDPTNVLRLAITDGNGNPQVTLDGGATWLGPYYEHATPPGINVTATNIKWLNEGKGTQQGVEAMAFDTVTAGRIWNAYGWGVMYVACPSSGNNNLTTGRFDWIDDSAGIECGGNYNIVIPPGQKPVVGVFDRGFNRIVDEIGYTNTPLFPAGLTGTPINEGWFVDYVPGQPTHLVGCCSFFENAHCKSVDAGRSWTKFSGNHPTPGIIYGGCIVAASDTDYYWFPSQNVRAAETHDGGATWAYISDFPAASNGETGFGFGMFNALRPASSNKTTGDVYCYNYGPGLLTSLQGVWKKTYVAGGSGSWVQKCTTIGGIVAGYSARLRCVPGQNGHLFWHGNWDTALWRSTDDAVTWATVPNTSNITAVGFGAAIPGRSYPTVFFAGLYNGNKGVYASFDNFATVVKMTDYPMGDFGIIVFIDGPIDVPGKVYLGHQVRGGFIGTYGFTESLAA